MSIWRNMAVFILLLSIWAIASAADLPRAFTIDDIDLSQCASYSDGKKINEPTADQLKASFITGNVKEAWETGELAGKTRHFLITFKQPIEVGTIYTADYNGPLKRTLQPLGGNYISLLKTTSQVPADVSKEDQWNLLPAGDIKILPTGTKTRAIRFTMIFPGESWGASWTFDWNAKLTSSLWFKDRYYNSLLTGGTKRSSTLNTAQTMWLTWNEMQSISGIVAVNVPSYRVDILKESVTRHALVATEIDWIKSKDPLVGTTLLVFPDVVNTKGVRLVGPMINRPEPPFGKIIPLTLLAANQDPPSLLPAPPPVKIKYNMPMDGFSAIEIMDKKTGKLVRRLLSETAREKGEITESWDLLDNNGDYVAPGDYTWKGIVRPPFKLTYELTANNAGQPGWWAPIPGKGGGGWLADHGAPNCAAAQENMMWFGSWVCENGHAAIATDLEGNKLWGTHSLSWGFRGPNRIAVDDRCAYLATDTIISRVDPKRDFLLRQLYTFTPTETLPWNGSDYDCTYKRGGIAVKDGKLYCSVNTPPKSWLCPSFASDVIDPSRCQPVVFLKKGKGSRASRADKNYGEGEYDELMQLYSCFLTEKTPTVTKTMADTGIPNSTQGGLGDAPTSGKLPNSVVVAFKKPIAIGSILIPDCKIAVYALKKGEKVAPPGTDDIAEVDLGGGGDAEDNPVDNEAERWILLKNIGEPGKPGIAVAPEGGIYTAGLRYKVKRLAFSQVMAHRMENVATDGEIVFNEGKLTPQGGWMVTRDTSSFNKVNPAVAALVWDKEQLVRGISLIFPVLSTSYVEIWNGAANEDPKKFLTDNTKWKVAGTVDPIKFNGYYPQAPSVRSIDFGEEKMIRAVRIRFTDCLGEKTAGFQSIFAFRSMGDDLKDLPEVLNERITVFEIPGIDDDKGELKILKNIKLPKPNNLTFAPDGTLYCVSDGQVVTVPLNDGDTSKVVITRDKLAEPASITFDKDGMLYVGDDGPKVIKIFDIKTGKLVRTVGTPGGQQLGKWDPARMDMPAQIAVDKNNRVWVADFSYQPKRIMRFDAKGQPDKWFLGPTQYGGGGWMDEGNHSVVNYNGMKFVIDWKTSTWKLDSLIYRPADLASSGTVMPDRVVYYKNRRYLVGPALAHEDTAVICEERNNIAVPMAAIGSLDSWTDIDTRPDLREAFGSLDRKVTGFCWYDKNGNGKPEADEVQTFPSGSRVGWNVGEDLTFIAVGKRVHPTGIMPNGVPMYDIAKIENFKTFTHGDGARNENIWGTADGRSFIIGTRLVAADGKTQLWEYFNQFAKHDGFYASGFGYNRPAGVLNQEHKPIGHIYVGKEEYFFTNTDQGDWMCYTGDGMLVGCIFGGPAGYGLRRWTMPEWEPGKVDLSDVRLSQEHYQGCVVKAENGVVYAVAGHNHMSIVRVDGLEQLQRLNGELSISVDDINKTQAWSLLRAMQEKLHQEPKVAKIPNIERPINISGSLEDWPAEIFMPIHEFWKLSLTSREYITYATGAMAYDFDNLYITAKVQDDSPFKNSADNPTMMFKGGDAVDVTLGLDPKADPKRTMAVAGDIRILIGVVRGKPVAVLYKPVDPTAPADKHAKFTSPVGQTLMDRVEVIQDAKIAIATEPNKESTPWAIVEVAIPWTSLGATTPETGTKLRGDIGILESDANGVSTINRLYWSGKSQTVICDIPSEAKLTPSLWGELYFQDPDKSMKFSTDQPEDPE
ncbi:MAG: hypothetical protein WCO98_01255 [bacterium]